MWPHTWEATRDPDPDGFSGRLELSIPLRSTWLAGISGGCSTLENLCLHALAAARPGTLV